MNMIEGEKRITIIFYPNTEHSRKTCFEFFLKAKSRRISDDFSYSLLYQNKTTSQAIVYF
jgi:hypothetical protein